MFKYQILMKMQFHMRKQGNVLDDVLIGKKVTHFEHFSTVVEKKNCRPPKPGFPKPA